MAGYDITGISPIGLNMGGSFSDYSSYLPSAMGMAGMSALAGGGTSGFYGGGYGAGTMGSMGMMGMMAPMMEYQQYMTRLQNQLDLDSLNHTKTMHRGMIDNEVQAHEDSLSGIVQKLLADSAAQDGVMKLYHKIQQGDQNGIIQEYDKLQAIVLAKFDKEINSHGTSIARAADARRIITSMYNNMINSMARDGKEHDLYNDIKSSSDSAFKQGVVCGFRGESDQRYREETLNHIYGERIEHWGSKQSQEKLGKGIGIAGSVFRDIGEGAAIGAGTWVAGLSALNLITLLLGSKWWAKGKLLGKGASFAAAAGILALGAHDIIKRTNSKSEK